MTWTKFKNERPTEDGYYWVFRKKGSFTKRIVMIYFNEDSGYSLGLETKEFPFNDWMYWKQIREPQPPW